MCPSAIFRLYTCRDSNCCANPTTVPSGPSHSPSSLHCAHQGGLIASHILDELYTDLSKDDLQKLEVYTFGSAALHFNDPLNDPPPSLRAIPHIEHYCNEFDMVTSWGALPSN
ncbi:hypothetical protein BKA63DRAFT_223923 [Paraphoma chrysanthemicola]|nr:hypothetical protein BKA63DRAFT_223923 [Paraphoma chrysanthemicola]